VCVLHNTEARSCDHCCGGKEISIAYFECAFLDLAIQHALRMHLVMLSAVIRPALPYFCTLSQKRHDFRIALLSLNCVF
jgi:hypothetical protein